MKTCFKCLCAKPLAEFYKHAQMRDGHLNKCIACTKADALAHRLANIDHYREYDKLRASMPHRKTLAKRVQAEWKEAHPKRRAANTKLGNAVRSGLVKKQPCWVCGAKAVAHHPDYDAPLDVVWLCQPHHKQAHALVREPEPEYA